MSPLLAPVLAQLINLHLADRTEARYVKYDSERYEGSTIPKATLTLASGRVDALLSYGPRLTVAPLETTPRFFLAFHEANGALSYRLRRDLFSLTSYFGIGEVNFRFLAVQGLNAGVTGPTGNTPAAPVTNPGMTPPGMQPGTGTPQPGTPGGSSPTAATQPKVIDSNLRYYTSSTIFNYTHRPMKDVEVGAQAGYTAASGLTPKARVNYPKLRGTSVGVRASDIYRLSKSNTFTGNASLLNTWSSNGNFAATLMATETFTHQFDPHTMGALGAGLNITRFAQFDGLKGYSVFPNFQATFAEQFRIGRGTLSVALFAYSAPALDPLLALVDPRVGFGVNSAYARGHFLASLTSNVALSIAPEAHDNGALNAAQAQGLLSYGFGDAVTLDGGVRYARQGYQGTTVMPDTWVGFVGVTLGLDVPITGNHP